MSLEGLNPESVEHRKDTPPALQELRMQGELLRIKARLQLKCIQDIWKISEQDLPEYFNGYEPMPHSGVNPQELFEMEKVKMIKTDNKLYFGQIENKKKNGIGIALYRQGKLYEGQFVNNEKSGHGCEIYANGNVYVGSFGQNKKHGSGSFFWFTLCENEEQKEIEQYHGEWWGGLPDGMGEHHKINGDLYVGRFKNGLKHGDGLEMYGNGDKYKGEFVNGFPEGYGDYMWSDGSSYKGDFKQGARNGYGMWKNGAESYKGHYMLDRKHGYGIYDWGNGYQYKGQWLQDLRHGEGTLLFNSQVQYDGYWQGGEQVDEKPSIKPTMATTLKDSGVRGESGVRGGSMSKATDKFGNSRIRTAKEKNSSCERRGWKSKNKDEFSVSFTREKSEQKSRCGHRNCIPHQNIGKMPKPNWKP